jgi:hypothetical protein
VAEAYLGTFPTALTVGLVICAKAVWWQVRTITSTRNLPPKQTGAFGTDYSEFGNRLCRSRSVGGCGNVAGFVSVVELTLGIPHLSAALLFRPAPIVFPVVVLPGAHLAAAHTNSRSNRTLQSEQPETCSWTRRTSRSEARLRT